MSNDCKPFSILHARAGAPYACRNGDEATILKWDARREHFPLIGITGDEDVPLSWTIHGGAYLPTDGDSVYDLVMTPLGYIDGKPVFVGDKIVSVKDGSTHTAYPTQRNFVGAFWPEPAQQYPVTGMTVEEISDAWGPEFGWTGMRNFADKVLRHAIDNATVATREAYDQCRADLLAAEQRRDERDMVVAKVVKAYFQDYLVAVNLNDAAQAINMIGLAGIISDVPA